jgi:4-hydroxy 2-oxovalerate aldolase
MKKYNFNNPIKPIDLVYGFAGCHSSFGDLFVKAANQKNVELYPLIVEVSKIDRKTPTIELIERIADKIKYDEL